jgi:hypothetical protein
LRWAPPLDVCDVVVRLETAGITDAVAEREYAHGTTWRLAEACFPWSRMFVAAAEPEPKPSVVLEYLKGVAFSLPLLLCCLAMALFHFALWGGDVSANMAAAVGLGTVSSFITTGGIVQTMARRGLFFISVNDGATAEAACWQWVRLGLFCLATSGVVLFALARFYTWLPSPFDGAAVAFHLSLGLLWLATGILHMLERNIWTATATAMGTLFVVAMHRVWEIELASAQILGILIAAGVAFSACFFLLRNGRQKHRGHPRPQSFAFDAYIAWPHFLFGTFYYVLVFADRLLAWTVPDIGAPSSLQFRGDYETALDLALIAFVLQVGNVRSSTATFFHNLISAQKQLGIGRRGALIRQMKNVYIARSMGFLGVAAVTSIALYTAVAHATILTNDHSYIALIWALFGFSCLVSALWNTSLLLRLAQSSDVLGALIPAILLNIVLGYALTRLGTYHDAAVGFATGALCYALLTTRSVLRRMQSIDYYYFASAS